MTSNSWQSGRRRAPAVTRLFRPRSFLVAPLLLPLALANSPAAAARQAAPRPTRLCAPAAAHLTRRQMRTALVIVRARLRHGLHFAPEARQAGARCILATLPTGRGGDEAARQVGVIGDVVIADGGSQPLASGAAVRLVCRRAGCDSHAPLGHGNLAANPPALLIVIPDAGFRRGSVTTGFDRVRTPTLTYSLTPTASSVWCRYTTNHVNRFAPVVVDGRVLSDPEVLEAMCGGQVTTTGLRSAAQARMLAAYINYGPLPARFNRS